MKKKWSFIIDLFSGCGWFSYWFQQEWFKTILWIDNVESALKTFERNHEWSKWLLVDLFKENSIDEIIKEKWDNNIDIIIAWPPCQGFSLTWTRKENDERNTLFYSVFKLAWKVKPKAIVIENVPWIVNLYWGKVKNEIYRLCEELWYTCNHKELFAPDYGVPQIRKRVFFVALKKEYGVFEFPEPTHRKKIYVTTEDAIWDLHGYESMLDISSWNWLIYTNEHESKYQKLMRKWSSELHNHVWTKHTDLVIDVISQVPEWWNHKDLPPWVWESRKFNEAWTRYHSKKPSKTIDTWHRNHFHYLFNRVPTVRENARLQSFPDKFKVLWTKTQQYKQIWNAVPPLLWRIIAKELKKYIWKK